MTVVVVGGGIVGMASAYYLRRRGVDVTVLERSSVGAGSTERAVGGIRAQFSSPVNVRLSLAAMAVWDEFEETFGVDIEHRRVGYALLARDPDTADRLRGTVEMQRELGVEVETLAPAALRDRADVAVHADRFELATYGPRDGVADPHLALQGFATAAREAGTEIRTNTPVRDVRSADGRVAAVETDDGSIDCEYVVNAAGPWAGRVGQMVGLDLPVSPQRRQVAVVAPERPVPETAPLTFDADRGVYFLPDREGDALVGGHFGAADERDPDDYPTDYDLDWALTALERAADCAAHFGPDTGLRRGWSGLYAVTPDRSPIVEESRPGFVNAVGFSGHGVMHAPATGQVIAEIVTEGAPRTVDVSALRLDRFRRDGTDERGHRPEANVL
jgi:sarcosine oxidase subunit beta